MLMAVSFALKKSINKCYQINKYPAPFRQEVD